MAKSSIPGPPLSSNEISFLAHVLERSFEYYIDHSSIYFTEYLRSLRTVIGLGFTAVLIDKSLLSAYQIYLSQFLAQKEGNFKECPLNKTVIAQSTANMVALAVVSFIVLRHPRYYEDFIEALRCCIARIPGASTLQHDVEEILRRLTLVS